MTSFIVAFAMLAQAAQATWTCDSRVQCEGNAGHAIVASNRAPSRPLPLRTNAQVAGVAEPADKWFAADKVRHFGVAFAVTGLTYAGLRAIDVDRGQALAGAGTAALIAGLGKELYDRRVGRGFSMRDLAWDMAGTVAALVLLDRTR